MLEKKLYNSKKYENGEFVFKSQMVDLVLELEKVASEKNLNVSRWQNNKSSQFDATVTWAVHSGERPAMSKDLPSNAHVISFDGIEGKTPRSRSYKCVKSLLDAIQRD